MSLVVQQAVSCCRASHSPSLKLKTLEARVSVHTVKGLTGLSVHIVKDLVLKQKELALKISNRIHINSSAMKRISKKKKVKQLLKKLLRKTKTLIGEHEK